MSVVWSVVLSAVGVAAVVALVVGLYAAAAAAGANGQRAAQSEQDLRDAEEQVKDLHVSRDRARWEIVELRQMIRDRYAEEARTRFIPAVHDRQDAVATQVIPAMAGGHGEASTQVIPAYPEPTSSPWLSNGERLS